MPGGQGALQYGGALKSPPYCRRTPGSCSALSGPQEGELGHLPCAVLQGEMRVVPRARSPPPAPHSTAPLGGSPSPPALLSPPPPCTTLPPTPRARPKLGGCAAPGADGAAACPPSRFAGGLADGQFAEMPPRGAATFLLVRGGDVRRQRAAVCPPESSPAEPPAVPTAPR
ncbi:unnamed protein product [Coccothraustes coccothraustes]